MGGTVGYQVRFEEVAGAAHAPALPHRRRAHPPPALRSRRWSASAAVVLDEFHERHLEGDLALALLRRLQRTARPDLRLVVMSATLDAAPVAAYLGGARVMRSEGRQYPLEIEYTPHSAAPLEEQVAAALERLAARGLAGPRAGLPAGRGRDPPRADRLRARWPAATAGCCCPCTAINRPKSRTAPWGRREQPQGHPLHQRGGKLHHHRRRRRRNR